jgi:hypothetical protein
MGYSETLEAAGAKVIEYKTVGSYQGSWGAIVEYNGVKSLVTGSYGSCSGCDAFEAEFGFGDEPPIEKDGKYYRNYWSDDEITKEEHDSLVAAYDKKMSDFGASYLQTLQDEGDIQNRIKGFIADDWFDAEEKELYEWALTFFNPKKEEVL